MAFRSRRSSRGFTLIELMVVVALSLVGVVALVQVHKILSDPRAVILRDMIGDRDLTVTLPVNGSKELTLLTLQAAETAEDQKDLQRRAPVVTIMGHVDHGKTSILDAIREAGWILDRRVSGVTQYTWLIGKRKTPRQSRAKQPRFEEF